MAHGKSAAYLWGTVLTGVVQLLFIWSVYPLGTYCMVIGFVTVSCLSLLYWHKVAGQLISLSIWHVLKDIAPYLAITGTSVLIAWFVTLFTTDRYISFFVKSFLYVGSYLLIAKFLDSTMLKESLSFIKNRRI